MVNSAESLFKECLKVENENNKKDVKYVRTKELQ